MPGMQDGWTTGVRGWTQDRGYDTPTHQGPEDQDKGEDGGRAAEAI